MTKTKLEWRYSTSMQVWLFIANNYKLVTPAKFCLAKNGTVTIIPYGSRMTKRASKANQPLLSMQSIESLIWHEGRLIMILWPHVNCQHRSSLRGRSRPETRATIHPCPPTGHAFLWCNLTYQNQITGVRNDITLSRNHGPLPFCIEILLGIETLFKRV